MPRRLGDGFAYSQASMRPPQKAGGNVEPSDDAVRDPLASMRPPQKAGGNSTARAYSSSVRSLQ